MISNLSDPFPELLDLDDRHREGIHLESADLTAAAQISASMPDEDHQWQLYLETLALTGFRRWVQERAPDLSLESFPPERAGFIPAALAPLQVGSLQLCLLVSGSLLDQTLSVPQVVIDQAEPGGLLYVWVSVEEDYVSVDGLLWPGQLALFRQSEPLQVEADGTYALPTAWFDPNLDHLLLYCRCLDPGAGTVGVAQALPGGRSSTTAPPQPTQSSLINVGCWFEGELDAIAQAWSWILLPPQAWTQLPHPGLRETTVQSAPEVDVAAIIRQLGTTGIEIPDHARGAYRIFQLAQTDLRFYLIAWPLPASGEWTLLVILGTLPQTALPPGLKLQVSTVPSGPAEQEILTEQIVTPESELLSLYTRVIGDPTEQFEITVQLAQEEQLTLPPIGYLI